MDKLFVYGTLMVGFRNHEKYNQPGSEDLYTREIRKVQDEEGNIICCYVYLWSNMRLDYLKQAGKYIPHGDWRKFIRDNNYFVSEED